MEVRFDLHIHSEHSPDGRMSLDEIVSCARAAGLQGVAVCDHDRALTETWDAPDFLLIPGVELSTDQGHLLGLFVTEQIEARELGAAIDAVHACGGLAVMAHPFERSCDAQRLDAYLDRLDGIEVWNGRADRKNPQANAMACALAQRAQKPVTAGSDAHLPEEIGNGVVTLEVDALTLPAVRALTDVLLDTLAQYGARGSFDVIGDTSANYPDEAGKLGSAAWGGVRFDHYPDIHCDEQGGAEHNDRLIRRMLAEGHQITNHGYRHILFGKKPFVYGAREYLPGFDAAVEDLGRLHALMQTRYGYTMTLARPPHYVDKMTGGFTSYDVYDRMGYQYMAASFDGAGWLPSTDPDPEAALQAEIRAMVEPMRKALEKDPDFFCGQIIFQKDGYNMAKRTPVAFALGEQLALLQEYGYQVVPVGELLAESPFADVGREEPLFDRLTALAEQRAIVFSDNRLRLDDPMTVGELAMLLTPKADAIARRVAQLRRTGRAGAYDGAMAWCRENGLVSAAAHPADHVTALPEAWFVPTDGFTRRDVYAAFRMERL